MTEPAERALERVLEGLADDGALTGPASSQLLAQLSFAFSAGPLSDIGGEEGSAAPSRANAPTSSTST